MFSQDAARNSGLEVVGGRFLSDSQTGQLSFATSAVVRNMFIASRLSPISSMEKIPRRLPAPETPTPPWPCQAGPNDLVELCSLGGC